jgi:hypothetical protein
LLKKKAMVGNYRKFDKLVRLCGNYAPLLNGLAPGLGDLAHGAVQGVRYGGRFANAAYKGYKGSKQKSKFGRVMSGIKSGFNSLANWKSKDINELSDKIQLEPNSDELYD